jgi:hypothetical protein
MRKLRVCGSGAVPNKSFEPTLESSALSLRVRCGAAQLRRWASEIRSEIA